MNLYRLTRSIEILTRLFISAKLGILFNEQAAFSFILLRILIEKSIIHRNNNYYDLFVRLLLTTYSLSYTFYVIFRHKNLRKTIIDKRYYAQLEADFLPISRSVEKEARVCLTNSTVREYRGALPRRVVRKVLPRSLEALPPPPCVVAEAQQNGSRGVASAARNGNTGDRSAGLPVFVPVLRGFSHTRPRSFRSYTLARARFLRRAYASDRLVRSYVPSE